MTAALNNDQLRAACPALFAEVPHAGVSDRYSFYRTIEVVDALRAAGWRPTMAGQGRARDLTRSGLQRHVVRLRHPDMNPPAAVGELVPELVLTNSHDGTTAYKLHAGIFRFVCENGLIVADSTFSALSVRHTGRTIGDVVDASFKVAKEIPGIVESVKIMRETNLSGDEQRVFAESAALLRWEGEAAPVLPHQLNDPKRYEDNGPDLWRTMNRVQENLVRGGLRGRAATGRRLTTRPIASVSADTKINKALWHLAEEMRRLKSAA